MSSFDNVKAKLTELFQQAVIQNNFKEFIEKADLDSLPESIDSKNIIELTIRYVLLQLITENANVELLERVFQFSIESALCDTAAGNIPVLVISDLFEASTIVESEKYFCFLESRVETFKMEIFFKSCKNHLLRTCNDLLKRLSRSQNTVFCGRILMFLANIFPLSERSGLNIISEFNLENTTVFSTEDEDFSDLSSEKGEIDDETTEQGQTSIIPDKKLYQKFWAVQEFFRNPNNCYNKLQWRQFASCTADIMTVFGSFKSDDAAVSKWKQLPSSSGGSVYFAKYLTSPKLLELELSDSHFRRYVLVQFLILFQYLSSPVKFKLESYVLTDEQQTWIKNSTKNIYKLLEETPPNGAIFTKDVEKILQREEYWNSWKNDGCPDFNRVTDRAEIEERLKKRPTIDLHVYPNKRKNSEMNKPWNTAPNNWEACRSTKRNFVPAMDTFFGINSGKLEGGVSSLRKSLEDGKYNWKALRLLSMKSPLFFMANPCPAKNVSEYIENVVAKITKEKNQNQADVMEGMEDSIEDGGEEPIEDGPTPEEDITEEVKVKTENILSKPVIESLSGILEDEWQTLAPKLGFQEDEIEYYEKEFPDDKTKTKQMLTVWSERDGTIEQFISILEDAGFSSALHILQPGGC